MISETSFPNSANDKKRWSNKTNKRTSRNLRWRTCTVLLQLVALILIVVLLAGLAAIPFDRGNTSTSIALIFEHAIISFSWSLANWMPISNLSNAIQRQSWEFHASPASASASARISPKKMNMEIPRIPIRELLRSNNNDNDGIPDHVVIATYLEETYGNDWRERPLLLEGILDHQNHHNTTRHLSLEGLLQLDLEVPYFETADQPGALTPTAQAPVSEIVQGMLGGKPYKIGSQLIVQANPDWIEELTGPRSIQDPNIGPRSGNLNLLSELFGNHFGKEHLQKGRFLPATTTVPVFIGKSTSKSTSTSPKQTGTGTVAQDQDQDQIQKQQHTITGLHCEPIGSVAFQIEGEKEWTLVAPEHSARLEPSLSADGRAYFASSIQVRSSSSEDEDESFSDVLTKRQIPHWTVVNKASDALWVPTWTWHRIDYRQQDQDQEQATCVEEETTCGSTTDTRTLAIGGSIFHFRAWDFLRRNPLYAVLIVPALVKELAGITTQ